MESLLLSLHVLAGILFVGPVAVTTSLFPRYAPVLTSVPVTALPSSGTDASSPRRRVERSLGVATALSRITAVYGVLALTVPVIGLILAAVQGRLTEVWIVVAMVLTAIAGALLVLQIVPRQREALTAPDGGGQLRRLGMMAGIFNLLWAVVVVLMIVRPGSSYS